jgi:hypothetical protein
MPDPMRLKVKTAEQFCDTSVTDADTGAVLPGIRGMQYRVLHDEPEATLRLELCGEVVGRSVVFGDDSDEGKPYRFHLRDKDNPKTLMLIHVESEKVIPLTRWTASRYLEPQFPSSTPLRPGSSVNLRETCNESLLVDWNGKLAADRVEKFQEYCDAIGKRPVSATFWIDIPARYFEMV